MLDMGFIKDVKYIITRLPAVRQSLCFSATVPEDVEKLMNSFLNDPVRISVKIRETPVNVDQDIVRMGGRQKADVLHDLLKKEGFDKVLVFGRTKWGMDKLAKFLSLRGVRVAAIHSNRSQNQRQRALENFKSARIQVLLATDIASRGLDIDSVTHVINFDLPGSYEDYIHRIGRTGRVDRKGTALTFIE
jgi:superfamily II DNA/RNA helicase